MYLADTNAISTGAPGQRDRHPGLVTWIESNGELLFLSVVTLTEIAAGIAKARRGGAVGKADRLQRWFGEVVRSHGSHVLAVDAATAMVAGAMADVARGQGHAPDLADILIAATAQQHGLTVLTRNIRHFGLLGVPCLDPFARLPPT